MLQKVLASRIVSSGLGLFVLSLFLFIFLLQVGLDASDNEALKKKFGFKSLIRLENLDYDFQVRLRTPPKPSTKVAVIEINESSLAALGRFPFTRRVYAELIQKLRAVGAAVLAFDMVFAEPEEILNKEEIFSGIRKVAGQKAIDQVASELAQNSPDTILARELKQGSPKIVLGYVFDESQALNSKPLSPEQKEILNFGKIALAQGQELEQGDQGRAPVLPLSSFWDKNESGYKPKLGHFNVAPDEDGVIRHSQLFLSYQKSLYAFLPIKALEEYLGSAAIQNFETNEILFSGTDLRIPIGPNGTLNYVYYGPARTFPTYELVDVLKGKVGARELSGKILFLGATAFGLKDLRSTPFDASYPGVESHATFVSNVLEQNFVIRGRNYALLGILAIFLGGLIIAGATQFLSPLSSFFISLGVAALQFYASKFFLAHGQWVPLFIPLATYASIFASVAMLRFLRMDQEKKFLRSAFSRYVSQSIVAEIIKNPGSLRLSGEKRELTVLFADVKGFTTLSENMEAHLVAELLNDFFTAMADVILEHKGTIDKFMGDALMCFWGAPVKFAEHAKAAADTALAMQEKLAAKNAEWELARKVKLEMRIGINTGAMAVGNMGSKTIFSYTVVGDQVNLASRFESANGDYGTHIIVGESTKKILEQEFLFRRLDQRTVRGRQKEVSIFELIGKRPQSQRTMDWVESYERAWQAASEQNWQEAERALTLCLELRPGDAAALRLQKNIQSKCVDESAERLA